MRRLLQISLVSLSILGLAVLLTQVNSTDKLAQYQPRSFDQLGSQGAIEYLNMIKANQITGTVDPADVVAAQNHSKLSANKKGSLNLQWTAKGPSNIGGRARALLFDKDDPNTMFLGSVTGGIFRSKTGGSSWIPVHDNSTNVGVTAIAQTADGTLYYGTGEGLHNSPAGLTLTSAGFVGGGMFKSTDGGDTWNAVASTTPTSITSNSEWSAIANIIAHPTDAGKMWAGTNRGIRYTTNGGTSWSNPITGPGSTSGITDMHMDSQGGIWASLGSRVMYAANGTAFVEISKTGAGPTDLPRGQSRVRVETAPADPNYVYVVMIASDRKLDRVFKSTDKGATWAVIGQQTATWDPFQAFVGTGLSGNGQGSYDLAMRVDPSNKERLIIGGIDLWDYTLSGGWNIVSQWTAQPLPWYVHADNHNIFYHPTKANEFFVVGDGGLFKTSDNGISFVEMNLEFNTMQFYGIGIGADRTLIGGAQDNGTNINDGSGNTPRSAYEIQGGDGGRSAISWLDPDVYFAYVNQNLTRTQNAASSWQRSSEWFSSDMLNSGLVWNAPFRLHENSTDLNSADSIQFIAYPALKSLGFGNGNTDSFYNVMGRPQESAVFNASTFVIFAGGDTVRSDAQGNLTGDGTGMFNAANGEFYVNFTTAPSAEIIAICAVSYASGSNIILSSKINALPYKYTLTSALSTGDSLNAQDPVQAFYVVSVGGAVWMTRQALDFSITPEWWKVANIPGQTASTIEISENGDVIYVGTTSGRVVTVTNVSQARSFETADVTSGTALTTVKSTVVAGGRFVTSVRSDPNDPNKAVVTLGNYGNSAYVYYSSTAASSNANYSQKQGSPTTGLLKAPVYASVIHKGDGKKVVLGTEFGIYTTDDITVVSPVWTAENDGFANAPVWDLVQYRTNKSSDNTTTIKEGDIYIGSYGRGWYVSTSLQTDRPLSTQENVFEDRVVREALKMYPNPASDYTKVDVTLDGKGDVKASVLDMSGRVFKAVSMKGLSQGDHKIRIDLTGISNGTYVLSLSANGTVQNGKFIVNK